MKKAMILFSFCMTLLLLCPPVHGETDGPATGELVLVITGFESSQGKAMVALVDSAESFSQNELFRGYRLPIVDKRVKRSISLPYGEYAVKIYHDENANGKLDTRMLGIPAEGYGFSNNARGKYGPPDYEEAAFMISGETTRMEIEVR